MRLMIEWARHEGIRTVEGQVLRENAVMLAMCRKLGFAVRSDPDDADLMEVRLSVEAAAEPARLAEPAQLAEPTPLPA
jgi:acetyltransferase